MKLPLEDGPIGLLAGGGRFPLVFAQTAQELRIPVICVGIRGEASPELAAYTARYHWTRLGQLGKMIRLLKRAGVRRVVMAGKIHKSVMHSRWRIFRVWPDWRGVRFWYSRRRRDNRDDSLLLGIIDEFGTEGMQFASALDICPELLVRPGILTRRALSRTEELDIEFGWRLAKEMGRLDVGQSVAVKDRAVLAVEAIEGTDQAIARAGDLCPSGGFVVVKVAKPQQDMRFDVPTIGASTVQNIHRAGGKVLAIEANKTILMDEAATIALADQLGITIVARHDTF